MNVHFRSEVLVLFKLMGTSKCVLTLETQQFHGDDIPS